MSRSQTVRGNEKKKTLCSAGTFPAELIITQGKRKSVSFVCDLKVSLFSGTSFLGEPDLSIILVRSMFPYQGDIKANKALKCVYRL